MEMGFEKPPAEFIGNKCSSIASSFYVCLEDRVQQVAVSLWCFYHSFPMACLKPAGDLLENGLLQSISPLPRHQAYHLNMQLTPIGSEFEAIIVAVVFFLAGGAVSFICCFAATHTYLCYRRRILRKKRRHERSEERDVDYTYDYRPFTNEHSLSSAPSSHPTSVVVMAKGDKKVASGSSHRSTAEADGKLKRANTIATTPIGRRENKL